MAFANKYIALVEFEPTSSPELDALLDRYRETLFIPSVLSETHRRLIYRPTRNAVVQNEPGVTVTLPNDEDMKLRPMSLKERPNKMKSLPVIQKHLAATQDRQAWSNLIAFLEGMHVAKEPIPESFLEAITRKAYEQGQHSIPLRLAQLVKKTNYRLSSQRIAREVFLGCHIRAASAGFQGEELEAAAKQAELFAQLLEQQEHCGGRPRENEVDMRQDLGVVGVLLELAAARALSANGGKDTNGQVANYVAKALAMSQGKDLGLKMPSSGELSRMLSREQRQATVHGPANYLLQYLPLWHGMKLALEMEGVVSPHQKTALEAKLKSLNEHITKAVSQARKAEWQPKRALQMYDRLQSL